MNYFVPDFEMEDDDSIPISSRFARHKNYTLPDQDELVELLWENGKIVMQSQNQRSLKKSSLKFLIDDDAIPAGQSTATEFKSAAAAAEEDAAHQLFMQEDEMASWLHYPLDGDFSADLLYPTPSGHCASPCRSNLIQEDRRPEENPPVASRPPVPEVRRTELDSASTKFHNFMHFSLPKVRIASGPSTSDKAARDSTVVDSNETPAAGPGSLVSHVGRSTSTTPVSDVNYGCGSMSGDAAAVDAVRDLTTSELAMMSSSGGSGASVSVTAEPLLKAPADNRKRKAREAEYSECHSEDAEFESVDTRKQVCGSASTRRTRAAEVHNLSERKRRDRINEKMKALQELIPHCNKSDKASMLDEAIEYLKSLQLQVQMMSMGCSMVPMMFPCVQPYISPMGMGMGMGMEMGLSQPMLSYPSVFAGSSMPTPAAASHLGLRVPMPAIHVQPVPTADLSRIKATNQFDRTLNSIGRPSPNQPQIPNFADPCQHYLGLQQMQVPPPQSRAMAQPINNKGVETLENHQSVRPIDKHKQGH